MSCRVGLLRDYFQERIGPSHTSEYFPVRLQERIGLVHTSEGFPVCLQERIGPVHPSEGLQPISRFPEIRIYFDAP